MVLAIVLASLLATAPTAPQPTKTEQVVHQPMLAEPTKVYDLNKKKRK
jgi:hypothetical protein